MQSQQEYLQVPKASGVAKCGRSLRIAIVYGRPPIPMTRADQKTVAHLIEFLAARGHQIDLFSLAGEEPLTEVAQSWLTNRCQQVSIEWKSKTKSILNSACAALRGLPLQIGYFWSKKQAQVLAANFRRRNYDLVYVYYIRSALVYKKALELAGTSSFHGVSFLGMQLSQSLNTRRIVENLQRRIDRVIYSIESKHVRRFEARVCKLFDRVVLVGPKDLEELQAVCRESRQPEPRNVFLCAHGVDLDEFDSDWSQSDDGKTLMFSGVMRTNTNVHAITWFAQNVWPHIREAMPEVKLNIVGRQPSIEVRRLGELAGVTVVGEVASISEYIRKATVCINPMQVGAGMQNKLLEFMAMGKAVVATSLANEGIGARPEIDLIVADSPKEFATRTLALLADSAARVALGRNARAFVEQRWSWDAQFLLLEREFFRAVEELRFRKSGHSRTAIDDERV